MGYGFSGMGCGKGGKGGFDESIIIWILVIFLLLGDRGCKDFGKGGCDDSMILIIVAILLLFGGGGCGFLGLGTELTEES